ncbi:helix-turn-helix transcriptional regulator [Brevibacillus sp. DP1.3A]|uniref:helix-turn-helix domain-containing protein n=1 Tax=Brevibacillus sp. DP1.3A TaxID=2738867 RepID=UPI00156BAD79|nr:helix-turn-helix transcriptional regulator [Brevibacillus sp. DP1.3A]UED78077.1 helix-turn-helix transcriptional regulator [Brevibacillus sp. DP1.3A]
MSYQVGRCLLADRLKDAGMTPAELAEKLGMSLSQISEYIHNKRVMTLKNARTISEMLGCSMESMYEWIKVTPDVRKQNRRSKG